MLPSRVKLHDFRAIFIADCPNQCEVPFGSAQAPFVLHERKLHISVSVIRYQEPNNVLQQKQIDLHCNFLGSDTVYLRVK
jgi:hypothetical protein